MKGLFITGTDTDVGKTWVAVNLIRSLRNSGFDIEPRKPVESGWQDIKASDAWALAKASNKLSNLEKICPNHFNAAISPDKAALLEGITVSVDLAYQQCIDNLTDEQILIVEGAGGFYSPLCCDGLNADLANKLKLPVLLVVGNRLGCINHTLLTLKAIKDHHLSVSAVVLNNLDEQDCINEMDNYESLNALTNTPIFQIEKETTTFSTSHSFDGLAQLVINQE